MDNKFKPKSFWKKPEGVTGAIFLVGIMAGIGVLGTIVFTGIIIGLLSNTLYLAGMLLVLGALNLYGS